MAAQKGAALNGNVMQGATLLAFDCAVNAVGTILLNAAHDPRHMPRRLSATDGDGRKVTRRVDKRAGLGVCGGVSEGKEDQCPETTGQKNTCKSRHGLCVETQVSARKSPL